MIFILFSYSINSDADNKDLNLSNSIPRVVLIELFVQTTCTTCPHAEFCLEELTWEYRKKFGSPYIAAELGYIDDVIEPSQARPKLISALEMMFTKRESRPLMKHSNIPL